MNSLDRYLSLPRAVHVLCVGSFINRAGTFLVPFLTIYLTQRLHYGESFATLCMGAYGLGAMGAALAGGHLADHVGRRRVMLFSLVGSALCIASFGYVREKATIVTLTILTAAVAEMYRPAASAMIADLTAVEQRPQAYGLMYVAINLGFACGAFIGGQLAAYSFSVLYWADALTSLTYAGIIFVTIRETLGTASAGIPPEASREPPVDFVTAASRIASDGVFVRFCMASFLLGLVYMQSFSTLPLYFQRLGHGPSEFGSIISINGWLIVLVQLPLTAAMARFNRANVIIAAALFTAAGFGLTGLVTSLPLLAGTVVVWTIGEMLQSPLLPAITTDLAPANLRARYFGMIGLGFSGANMIGAPLGGWVLAHGGGRLIWLGTFVSAMTAAALYVSIHRKISKPST